MGCFAVVFSSHSVIAMTHVLFNLPDTDACTPARLLPSNGFERAMRDAVALSVSKPSPEVKRRSNRWYLKRLHLTITTKSATALYTAQGTVSPDEQALIDRVCDAVPPPGAPLYEPFVNLVLRLCHGLLGRAVCPGLGLLTVLAAHQCIRERFLPKCSHADWFILGGRLTNRYSEGASSAKATLYCWIGFRIHEDGYRAALTVLRELTRAFLTTELHVTTEQQEFLSMTRMLSNYLGFFSGGNLVSLGRTLQASASPLGILSANDYEHANSRLLGEVLQWSAPEKDVAERPTSPFYAVERAPCMVGDADLTLSALVSMEALSKFLHEGFTITDATLRNRSAHVSAQRFQPFRANDAFFITLGYVVSFHAQERPGRPRIVRRLLDDAISVLAKDGPRNWQSLARMYILRGERLWLADKLIAARTQFSNAIAIVREHHLTLEAAIVNERLMAFYRDSKNKNGDDARAHLDEAITHYRLWGAHAKVQRLTEVLESFTATAGFIHRDEHLDTPLLKTHTLFRRCRFNRVDVRYKVESRVANIDAVPPNANITSAVPLETAQGLAKNPRQDEREEYRHIEPSYALVYLGWSEKLLRLNAQNFYDNVDHWITDLLDARGDQGRLQQLSHQLKTITKALGALKIASAIEAMEETTPVEYDLKTVVHALRLMKIEVEKYLMLHSWQEKRFA